MHLCWEGGPLLTPIRHPLQVKAAKSEQEARRLQLRSLQYLERYVYLVLFNAYLHLEKEDSWPRPFSTWMREVRGGRRGCLERPLWAGSLLISPSSVWPRFCLV